MRELRKDSKKTKGVSLATFLPAATLQSAKSTENLSAMFKDKGIACLNSRKGDSLSQMSPDRGKSDVQRDVWRLEGGLQLLTPRVQ